MSTGVEHPTDCDVQAGEMTGTILGGGAQPRHMADIRTRRCSASPERADNPDMGWIGVTDHDDGWFSLDGVRGAGPDETRPGSLLQRGTLLVEARMSPQTRPRTLLSFQRTHPWPGRFSLQAQPDGGIVLADAQGPGTHSAVLPCPCTDRSDIVRLSYIWDSSRQIRRLTVEGPGSDGAHSIDLPGSHLVAINDLHGIITQPDRRQMDRDVTFAAISDRVEPVGPMPGLTAQTRILTPVGEVPVHKLRRGDVVMTDQGEQVPILQVVRRTVPARGGFRPVRLRAGYFGLTRDTAVASYQRLVLHGADVEYMFGSEAVLVPAGHLVNNVSAIMAKGPDMVTYYQVLLPGHEAIMASGCPTESLFVGRLRRMPGPLAASVLAPFARSLLPEHDQPVWPVLKPFEATAIAWDRAA